MEVRVEKQKEDRTWDKSELIVVDHTKSDAGSREVFLTEEARHILKEVQESNARNGLNSEYIFIDKNGQRISKNKISKYLDRLCKSIGLPPKSPHKARKTYISTLIDAGVNINTIRKQAGHANELTTYKNYCFDRMVDTQKEELLEKALSRKYNNEIVTKSNQKKQDF